MTLHLTEIEIAWLAGLCEGEANFGLDKRSAKKYKTSSSPPAPFLKISMVDEDIIKRVSILLNKNYFSPSRKTSTSKIVYTIHVGDRKTLLYVLPRLYPYFGKRRQKIVKECLDNLYLWQRWIEKGGRSEMAKKSALTKKAKKNL